MGINRQSTVIVSEHVGWDLTSLHTVFQSEASAVPEMESKKCLLEMDAETGPELSSQLE